MAVTSPRATARRNHNVTDFWDNENQQEWFREIARAVNEAFDGATNAIGEVTLTASSATTTLTDTRIGSESIVFLTPLTANAKAEVTPWQSGATSGSITLNHTNNAQTDRTYGYIVKT